MAGGAAAHSATELQEGTGNGTRVSTPSWEPSHSRGSLPPPLCWLPYLPPSAKTEVAALPRVAVLGCFQQVPSGANAGRLQGAEGRRRASCWETVTAVRMGPAGSPSARQGWQRPAALCSRHPCPAAACTHYTALTAGHRDWEHVASSFLPVPFTYSQLGSPWKCTRNCCQMS